MQINTIILCNGVKNLLECRVRMKNLDVVCWDVRELAQALTWCVKGF